MDKILIVTDSHLTVVQDAIQSHILQKPPIKVLELKPEFHIYENCIVSNHRIDILGLMGSSAYNFAKHIEVIKDRDYQDYRVILFMGFNDLMSIIKYKNHKVVVERYVDSAIERFGDQITILTPLKNLFLLQKDPEAIAVYDRFILYMKEYCDIKGIDCQDIYSILGPITKDDLGDKYHVKSYKLLPLYSFLGVI